MGSRYDIAILRNTSIRHVMQACAGRVQIGERVAHPGGGEQSRTIAEITTGFGTHVVIVGQPASHFPGIDSSLADVLGIEMIRATVWDTLSLYSLSLFGNNVNRYLSYDPEEALAEGVPAQVHAEGPRLDEEPEWEFDEAYIQEVCQRRTGIDPSYLQGHDAAWRSLLEPRQPVQAPSDTVAPVPARVDAAPNPQRGWVRIKSWFNRQ